MDYQHYTEHERALREELAETLRAGASLAEEWGDEQSRLALMDLAEKAMWAPARSMLELSAESDRLFKRLVEIVRRP